MSNLRVNIITNMDDDGSPVFTKGLSVEESKVIDTDFFNVSGIMTAGFFVGEGSGITNLNGVTFGKFFALSSIL